MSGAALAAVGSRPAPTGGEFAMRPEDFRRIAALLHAESGITLPETKITLVSSRLGRRLRALGLRSYAEYCSRLDDPAEVGERRAMLAALTTNVTRFFREPHHFEHLRRDVLPPLLEAARAGGRVRLWSAACSSGQEPYSMALAVLGLMPEAPRHDIRILATDIDPTMVAAGRAGTYTAEALSVVPHELRRRWFEPVADGSAGDMRAGEAMRRLVAFRELNLVGAWPMRGRFHAIFCRNVVIYFEEDTQTQLWARLAPMLEAQGALYIGHSERIGGRAASMLRPDGVTTYRPVGAQP